MSPTFFEIASFLVWPMVMSMILAGIHCYLGFHVLERGVIFVDLSLAQIAALGSTFALLLGFEHDGIATYGISLSATLLAAALFAKARHLEHKVPLEAIIGIVYAFGAACVILVLDRMAHGTEHIKSLLVGQILWVSKEDVLKVFLIYAGVAILHYRYRHWFLAASRGQLSSRQTRWDFAFYALFGVVITSSVHVAGVLQVFSYLIVPSVLANIWFTDLKRKLAFGWGFSLLTSFLAMAFSYLADLPSGAAMVTLFTSMPILIILLMRSQKSPTPLKTGSEAFRPLSEKRS